MDAQNIYRGFSVCRRIEEAALSLKRSRLKQIGIAVFAGLGVNNLENLAGGSNGRTCGEAITGKDALILSHAIFLQVNHFGPRIFGGDERGFAVKTRLANGGIMEGHGNSTVNGLWHCCCKRQGIACLRREPTERQKRALKWNGVC